MGRDENLDRPVALKVLHGETGDRQRFAGEVRLLAALDHPNLVRVYDAVDQPQAVLIMELVQGQSLAERLTAGPLTGDQVRRLGIDLAGCLAYLHQQGVVHRDVKPANILLGDDGRPRLADFGIARLVDATRLTQAGQTIGTLAYMAPEQLTGQTIGPPADIYALGLVMLEALTGRRAFPGTHEEVVASRLVRDPDMPPQVGGQWRSLLADMTNRQPELRPTARAVEQRLRGARRPDATEVMPPIAAANAATVALPVEAARDSDQRTRNRRGLAVAAALIVAVVVILVVIASQSGNHKNASPPAAATTTLSPTTPAPTSTSLTTTTSTPTTPTVGNSPFATSAASALAALLRDVATGETAGTINQGSAQAITNQSDQALTDEVSNRPNQAAGDIQQASMAIATGIQNGNIQPAEGSTLQADLATLAGALGLGAAGTPATAPTTAPATAPTTAPAAHNPPGKGH